jgi:hypothetical protein
MGSKSGCFSIQNVVIREEWTAIKRLKKGDTQLSQGVSEGEAGEGQKLGPGKMSFLGQLG